MKRKKVRRKKRARKPASLKGLKPGIRMKGGIRLDPLSNKFVAIVHTWDNIYCHGEPEEWRSTEAFETEEAAMQHYKTAISPSMIQMMAKMAKKQPDITVAHRKLEE